MKRGCMLAIAWATSALIATAAYADKYGIDEAMNAEGTSSIGVLGIIACVVGLLVLLAVVGATAEKWPAILPLGFLLLFVVIPLVRCATG